MFLNDVSRRRNYWQTPVAISKIARAAGPRSTTKIPASLSRRAEFAAQRAEAWEKYATHEEKYGTGIVTGKPAARAIFEIATGVCQ